MKAKRFSRRQILSGLAVATMAQPRSAAAAATTAQVEVAAGIFVHRGAHALTNSGNRGDIANLTIVIGADAVAIIDTGGSAGVGEALISAVKSLTAKPIRYVINTHMHPDHVLGNSAIAQSGVEFIAHHKMPKALAARAESYLARARNDLGDAAFAGTKIVYPTRTIDAAADLDLGGRKLTLTPRPTAHTDNDLTVFDTATATLIAGDLVFSEHIPTLDGSIVGWLKLLDMMAAEPAARVIPGHGPVSMAWPDATAPIRRYWSVLAADVREAIKAGATIEDATQTAGRSEAGKWLLFDDFHARNVTAAFAELEWE